MMNISKPFVKEWRSHAKKLSPKILKLTFVEEKPAFRGKTGKKKKDYDLDNSLSHVLRGAV